MSFITCSPDFPIVRGLLPLISDPPPSPQLAPASAHCWEESQNHAPDLWVVKEVPRAWQKESDKLHKQQNAGGAHRYKNMQAESGTYLYPKIMNSTEIQVCLGVLPLCLLSLAAPVSSSHSVSKMGSGKQVQKPLCWETGQ